MDPIREHDPIGLLAREFKRSQSHMQQARDRVQLAYVPTAAERPACPEWAGNPVGYAHNVLGVKRIWDVMASAAQSIHDSPYMTMIESGHGIGKTFLSAWLINYWFDCFNPSVVISTGPSYESICDTVWTEVRLQRTRVGLPDHFIGPAAPELFTSPNHWAKALSTNSLEGFQGRHRSRMLFLFEEATRIPREFWTGVRSMFQPGMGHAWVAVFNPTDISSQAYVEEQSTDSTGRRRWKVFSLPSLDHPNVVLGIENRRLGNPPLTHDDLPIPNAVTLEQVDTWVEDWCLRIGEEEAVATDFQWLHADGSKRWWRPYPDWEARCLGKWPSSPFSSVWSDYLFSLCMARIAAVPIHLEPQIGCDVARFGDDRTAIHTRWGSLSLSHEAYQGLRTTETAGRLVETARHYADMVNAMRRQEGNGRPSVKAKQIAMKVDDSGVGGGVVDILYEQGYNVIPINSSVNAVDVFRYPNVRSELWFQTARRALEGGIAFCTSGPPGPDGKPIGISQLEPDTVQRLKLQSLAPTWKMDSAGRRVVEPKDQTKKRLARSPDDMDAMNLAYYEQIAWEPPTAIDLPNQHNVPREGPPETSPVPVRKRKKLFRS